LLRIEFIRCDEVEDAVESDRVNVVDPVPTGDRGVLDAKLDVREGIGGRSLTPRSGELRSHLDLIESTRFIGEAGCGVSAVVRFVTGANGIAGFLDEASVPKACRRGESAGRSPRSRIAHCIVMLVDGGAVLRPTRLLSTELQGEEVDGCDAEAGGSGMAARSGEDSRAARSSHLLRTASTLDALL
jgi:hypothetical protein